MNKPKDLYLGRFNLMGEVHVLRCYAFSESQAKMLFINRIAKKVDRDPWSLMGLYSGDKDNFKVIKEFEMEEMDES